MQSPPERLGSFFLGAEYDLETGERLDNIINYDARDLTTHAVCVGMTGSGKTGLCIGLLEEAAIDKVPAILIDPKGDITNLLLQFPDMQPADFQKWINVDDARRKGQTIEEYAQATANMWRNGLADWGITSERIRTLQATTDYTIFTPGSDAGVSINILGSLAAPKLDFAANAEAIRERINGTVAALLGLIDVDADPVRSRESVLLCNIFEHFWKQGKDLDLMQLIMAIQEPPVRQIGVFDVDTFYPSKDRFGLAMAFNNLVAAPTFQSWLQGEPLDIDRLFFTTEGKPRHSIFYIAHLSDNERMFFVTLLLENILTWMRRQSGTTSLRALLYFDEVFGFFPPTAQPPTKRPLLTLLKQARAFGLGTILVTQNPVDIDYKGLTNAGTWFIGKLQAERDKARVLEGLRGAISEAGGNVDVDYDTLISQLKSRVFLLHNVHDDGPIVFHTRWAMSYLRGPLTRPQVSQLMQQRKALSATETAQSAQRPVIHDAAKQTGSATAFAPEAAMSGAKMSNGAVEEAQPIAQVPEGYSPTAPALDPNLEQVYVPIEVSERAAVRQLVQEEGNTIDIEGVHLLYEPAIVGAAGVRFVDRKRDIDQQTEHLLLVPASDRPGGLDWGDAQSLKLRPRDLSQYPERVDKGQGPFFAPAPESANSLREIKSIQKDLADWLYYNSQLTVNVHELLGLHQYPGESERAFKIRLQQEARERRDAEVDKLARKVEIKVERLEKKLRKEERELAEDEADYQGRRNQEWIGIGESVLGYVLGRRSSRAFSSAATKRRMTIRAKQDIEESKEVIEELKEDIEELEEELKETTEELTLRWANTLDEISTDIVKPRRADVDVAFVSLAWLPSWHIVYYDGRRTREATIAAYALPMED